jgi:hypothetical protein
MTPRSLSSLRIVSLMLSHDGVPGGDLWNITDLENFRSWSATSAGAGGNG